MTSTQPRTADDHRFERHPLPTWLVWMLVGGALAVAYPLLADHVPYDLTYLAVGFGAVTATAVGIARHRPKRIGPWLLLGAGVGALVLGDVVYIAQAAVAGDEPPFPSAADAIYLGGMLGFVAGGLRLALQRHRHATTRALTDAAMITVAASSLLWLAIGSAIVREPDVTWPVVTVGLAYPLLDAVLLGVLAALLLGGQRNTVATRLLATAFAVQFVTDAVYATSVAEDSYAAGGALDIAWQLSYVLIGAAALHPSMAAATVPVPARLHELSRRHMVAFVAPLLGAAGAVLAVAHGRAFTDLDRFRLDLTVVVSAGVVLVILILGRIADTTNELARTARQRDAGLNRELVVAELASELARADHPDEVRAVVAQARQLLPGVDREVQLVLADEPLPHGARAATRIPLTDAPDGAAVLAWSDAQLGAEHRRALRRLSSDVVMALDRCRLAADLRMSERRFRSLVRHAPDAITVHDPAGTLTYVSPALGQIVGAPEADLEGASWADLVHPDDADAILNAHTELVEIPAGTRVLEIRLRHHDGTWRWVETRLTNLVHDPSVNGIVANHRDITERQRLQHQLEHQATHDPLTGVANRRRFGDEVRRLGPPGSDAVVFLDLDHFKEVNDRLGHSAGDLVLREVARRLEACVRPGDLVARLGGDEFAVLLRETSQEAAARTARRLLDAAREPIEVHGEVVRIGASAGLSLTEPGRVDHDLLHDADLAMYVAKTTGRGRVERATPQVRELTVDRLALEADLRAALAAGDLSLFHRPVADLRTREVVGSQTELRWIHPSRGEVAADRFLPVAARIGVLDTLATWAFHEACWSARSWLDRCPGLRVAVPFPGDALRTPAIADQLEAALRASGLAGQHLVLEIQGIDLLDRTPALDDNIEKLRDAGVRIRATDLGTDTPMRVLRDASVDEVLLSAELVAGIAAGPEEAALGRAVLLLADSFGVDVVADGIATHAQLDALVDRGTRFGAGPLIGGPLLPADLATTLVRTPSTLDATPG